MTRIAEELLSLILDLVVDQPYGSQTLSQVALTSHQLLNLVRQRRSARLVIGGPDFHAEPQRLLGYLQKLLSLIKADPTLAGCITSLTLSHDTESAAQASEMGWGYSTLGWIGWTEITDAVSQLLFQLPSLRSLTITTHEPDAFTDWAQVPSDMQDALFHCFSLCSLEKLTLERVVNMELTPIIDCSNLANLTLIGVTLSEEDLAPVGEAEPMDIDHAGDGEGGARGLLERLEVGDCGIALEKLLKAFEREDARLSISGLRNLHVQAAMYDKSMANALRRLIRQYGDSIEELRFQIPVSCDRDVKELQVLEITRSLHHCPLLASLDIDLVLNWCSDRHEHALRIPHSLEPIHAIVEAIRSIQDNERHPETVRLNLSIASYPERTWSRIYSANRGHTAAVGNAIMDSDLWALLESECCTPSNRAIRIEVEIETPLIRGLPDEVKETELLKRSVVVEGVYRRTPNLTKNGTVNVYCLEDD